MNDSHDDVFIDLSSTENNNTYNLVPKPRTETPDPVPEYKGPWEYPPGYKPPPETPIIVLDDVRRMSQGKLPKLPKRPRVNVLPCPLSLLYDQDARMRALYWLGMRGTVVPGTKRWKPVFTSSLDLRIANYLGTRYVVDGTHGTTEIAQATHVGIRLVQIVIRRFAECLMIVNAGTPAKPNLYLNPTFEQWHAFKLPKIRKSKIKKVRE